MNSTDSTVLLYDTSNREKTQAYDCIYYDGSGIDIDEFTSNTNPETTQSVKYCVRPKESVSIDRIYDRSCFNEGVLLSFKQLKQLNISIEELLKWNSGVNVVDQYQFYLKNGYHKFNETMEDFICNCTQSGTFGILCEYKFSANTFEETIRYQFYLKKEYQIGSQLFGNITCYETSFHCEHGMRCLDWREICDGKQQCVNGTDEDHCEDLLLNECNTDTEYRCRNGMCIDEEYFLDGDIDCQDRSDEKVYEVFGQYNCFKIPNLNCDETTVPDKTVFSCGDGQMVPENDIFLQDNQRAIPCFSYREKQWMCELDDGPTMWTNLKNGHCLDFVDQTLDTEEVMSCSFIMKCSLSLPNQHYLCKCTGNSCSNLRSKYCGGRTTSVVPYPVSPILTPFALNIFHIDGHNYDIDRRPDYFAYIRTIKCYNGMAVVPIHRQGSHYYHVAEDSKRFGRLAFELDICDLDRSFNPIKSNNGNCWNDSYPNQAIRCSRSPTFECVSKYQINDNIRDCITGEDESDLSWFSNCSSIQKHRFQCSKDEPTCSIVWILGDYYPDCKNTRDEYSPADSINLQSFRCVNRNSVHCTFLRHYLLQSSQETTSTAFFASNSTNVGNTIQVMKFWSYCNTIWDLNYGIDEIDCLEWKCPLDGQYYQCQTGQCILFNWLCNGEWDCPDGSDEERFQLLTENSIGEYNLNMFRSLSTTLMDIKHVCLKKNKVRPFNNLCNYTYEYPCLLANVKDPLNFTLNRPCINLAKLGDGHVDCYGGLDERNLLNCSAHEQLGFSFKCDNSDKCIKELNHCGTTHRCPNGEDRYLCLHLLNDKPVRCDNELTNQPIDDVWCLDGTCMVNTKCNGAIACPYGEDEFFCTTGSQATRYSIYRIGAQRDLYTRTMDMIFPNYWSSFPRSTIHQQNVLNELIQSSVINRQANVSSDSKHKQELAWAHSKEGWICNRGVLAWRKFSDSDSPQVQCFCPPSYYGEWCQWMSDRLTVFTHFQDRTGQLSKGVIKILALFIVTTMNNTTTILDHHEYHFIPALNNFDEKHKFYFVYSRPHQLRLNTSTYAIRFEVYLLNEDETIQFLAVWIYKIPFNFLPSQRLAKVLKYTQQAQLNMNHTCLSNKNICFNRGKCYPLMNKLDDIYSYWCDCKNGSYGSHCEFQDQSCSINSSNILFINKNYCSQTSLCRPKYDDNEKKALCICPMSSYGSSCHLDRQCQMSKGKNPCLNGGICFVNYKHNNLIDAYICQCPNNYFGSKCEQYSAIIEMRYDHQNQSFNSSNSNILATVIQLFDTSKKEELVFRKQIPIKGYLPSNLKIVYGQKTLPVLGLIKLYINETTIHYHLLYTTSTNQLSMNITIIFNEENYCPHTSQLFQQYKSINSKSNIVTKYHILCNKDVNKSSNLLCFRDDAYFCLCDINNITQCLLYNQTWDQCQLCFFGGKCILGDENIPSDYICLCPQCYFGSRCQYTTQVLSFTLESLFSVDLFSSSLIKQKVSFIMYIITPALLFVYGIISNLFSVVVFRRPKPRLNGIGYYLLTSSIVSQLCLLFLFTKIVYILIGIKGYITQSIFNTILCKSLSFSLSSSTRIYCWLTAFITIERVYVAKYPKGMWLKHPKIAKRIIILICLITLASHVHETIEYITVIDHKYAANGTWCITEYSEPLKIYNQTITFIHYLIPFLINFICTAYLTMLIVRSRANTDKKKTRSQLLYEHLKKRKEIFVPSIMIILSGLPQFIISFSLACTELDTKWERYLLTVAYFFSYIPQAITFHLYVQPSTFFLTEFYLTNMGATLKQIMKIKARKKNNN